MSETEPANGGRISVSRDALRAELAEFKLSLLRELEVELEKKASARFVDDINVRVAALELHRANQQAVERSTEASFSRREKLIGLALVVASLIVALSQRLPF